MGIIGSRVAKPEAQESRSVDNITEAQMMEFREVRVRWSRQATAFIDHAQ